MRKCFQKKLRKITPHFHVIKSFRSCFLHCTADLHQRLLLYISGCALQPVQLVAHPLLLRRLYQKSYINDCFNHLVITSTSAYPVLSLPSALRRALNLIKRAFTVANLLICHKGLFLMLENSPSSTNFQAA